MRSSAWFLLICAACDLTVTGGDGERQCLDDFLAELGEDRTSIEAEAEQRGVDASEIIDELVEGSLDVADSLIDCSASESLSTIAEKTGGQYYESGSPEETVDHVKEYLDQVDAPTVDVAFLIDTTCSMSDDLDAVRSSLSDVVSVLADADVRTSAAWFRDDNVDDPWYGSVPGGFVAEGEVQAFLDGTEPQGGGDLPESLYDGLHQQVGELDWQGDGRVLIAITDAPPLTGDKTVHSEAEVVSVAGDDGVAVVTILVGW